MGFVKSIHHNRTQKNRFQYTIPNLKRDGLCRYVGFERAILHREIVMKITRERVYFAKALIWNYRRNSR